MTQSVNAADKMSSLSESNKHLPQETSSVSDNKVSESVDFFLKNSVTDSSIVKDSGDSVKFASAGQALEKPGIDVTPLSRLPNVPGFRLVQRTTLPSPVFVKPQLVAPRTTLLSEPEISKAAIGNSRDGRNRTVKPEEARASKSFEKEKDKNAVKNSGCTGFPEPGLEGYGNSCCSTLSPSFLSATCGSKQPLTAEQEMTDSDTDRKANHCQGTQNCPSNKRNKHASRRTRHSNCAKERELIDRQIQSTQSLASSQQKKRGPKTDDQSKPAAKKRKSKDVVGSGDLKPASSSSDLKPASASSDLKPASASSDLKPASSSSDLKPASASSDFKPASASSDFKPASASSDFKPSSASRDFKPASASSDFKPASASSDFKPTSASGRKGKSCVLPAALLNQVEKLVRDNVGAISTQVVAAAASADPPSGSKCLRPGSRGPRPAIDKRTSGATNVLKGEQQRNRARGGDAAGLGSGSETKVNNDTSRELGKDKNKTAKNFVADQDQGVVQDGGALLSEALQQTVLEFESVKQQKDKNEVLVNTVVKEDSSNTNHQKKKRKKKSKSKGQKHLSRGGSLVGILPDYIPENDSRLNRKIGREQVFNLSKLFSGALGAGQCASRPQRSSRPNYFFAVQITDTAMKEQLSAVHALVAEAEPRLRPSFVSVDSAHITLAVTHLADQEAVDRAKTGLEEFQKSYHQEQHHGGGEETGNVASSLQPLALEVCGLDHFNNNVVFAKVAEGEGLQHLQAIAASLRSHVLKEKIVLEEKAFAAHLTLMKYSKDPGKLKRLGLKKIPGVVYAEHRDKAFGMELVTSVQLCSMLKPKLNNYYHIEHAVSLIDMTQGSQLGTDKAHSSQGNGAQSSHSDVAQSSQCDVAQSSQCDTTQSSQCNVAQSSQ